jgi:hypothetical protein
MINRRSDKAYEQQKFSAEGNSENIIVTDSVSRLKSAGFDDSYIWHFTGSLVGILNDYAELIGEETEVQYRRWNGGTGGTEGRPFSFREQRNGTEGRPFSFREQYQSGFIYFPEFYLFPPGGNLFPDCNHLIDNHLNRIRMCLPDI